MNNTEVQRFLSNGMIYQIELIKEYQKRGLTGLENPLEAYKQEFDDMKRELRIPFVISTGIYSIIGDLQDELGDLKGSKELRIHIKDQIQNLVGVNHPYYLASVQDVVKSYWKLRVERSRSIATRKFATPERSVWSATPKYNCGSR